MDIILIEIVLACFLGGLISGLMGWAGSTPAEPFNTRKFVTSLGTALVAGIGYAVTLYTPSGNFTRDLLIALAIGAGGDALVNRSIGAIQASAVNKLTPVKTLPVTTGTDTTPK